MFAPDLGLGTGVGSPGYRIHANISLPESMIGSDGPPGGVRLRLRVPIKYAGKLSRVTVGSKPWHLFDPAEETINFPSVTTNIRQAARAIVAEFHAI